MNLGRRPIHSEDEILDAARALILDGGVRSATLNGVAEASGAPKGSIYHRFESLSDLLAELWLRAARRSQSSFLQALREPDPTTAAVAGALAIYDFALQEQADARLLASFRREDLIGIVREPKLGQELSDLNRPLETAFRSLARRLFGRASRATVDGTIFAVADLPMGAIRRHLIAGKPFPRGLRPQVESAVRAALKNRPSSTL